MPLSKNGKLYYTDEQFKTAKYEITALDYARRIGVPLVQQGRFYYHADHDSLVFAPNGNFYWNSCGISGDAIAFASYYEGKTFAEAVLAVAGEEVHTIQTKQETNNKLTAVKEKTEEIRNQTIAQQHDKANNEEFVLPERASDNRRLFAYLCTERKIDNQIVSTLVHEKMIYQSEKHNNVIFVGYDENGVARSGYQRGTITYLKEPYKRDVYLSNKTIPFVISAEKPCDVVYVFEAAIDAMSHATLEKYDINSFWRDKNRLALGGVGDKPLDWYLQHNPNIKTVCLCLDNDKAGDEATARLGKKYSEAGYTVKVQKSKAKDWNEDLVNFSQTEQEENKFSLLYSNDKPNLDSDNELEP